MLTRDRPIDRVATFRLRPDSWDDGIVRSVLVENEYRLPERFSDADIVIDGGAHIGAFSYACLRRGAGRAIAFEPEPENHALAVVNLRRFGPRAELHRAALWRSDGVGGELRFRSHADAINTGGGDVLHETPGPAVTAMALDALLDRLANAVRLLKLDCEGSEYPILLTARRLERVAAICGEYHEFGPGSTRGEAPARMRVVGIDAYNATTVSACLARQGFRVTITPDGNAADQGLFFAERP